MVEGRGVVSPVDGSILKHPPALHTAASHRDQNATGVELEELTDGSETVLHSHAASGAPSNSDYLVGTADAGLSNEIAVGTTPGGQLGGTWASPTVDASHSGSAHHSDAHTAASHSDQGATGAELETLTDGSDSDSLHTHPANAGIAETEAISGTWTFDPGSLLDKGSRVYDAIAFGATGNGSTDDTAAVQAAIDACATASGGVVWFPSGTYICTQLTWKTGVYGIGAGLTASIIKLKASTNATLIKGLNFDALTGGDTAAGIHDYGFRDIALDGNDANNTTGWVLQIYGYRPFWENVSVHSGKSGGLYHQWSTTTDPQGELDRDGNMRNCEFHHNTGDGMDYNGPGDGTFDACVFYYNTGNGVTLGFPAHGVKFLGCHSYGNDQQHCMVIVGVTGTRVTACQLEGSALGEVLLSTGANNSQFRDCHFFAAGSQTNLIGIEIDDAVTGTDVTGCLFENLTDGSIKLTSDGGGSVIVANHIFGTTGTAILGTRGSDTFIEANQITGGIAGSPNTIVTIASGAVTPPNGHPQFKINGESSSADILNNMAIEPNGTVRHILAGHTITFTHLATGSGEFGCPSNVDYVLAQGEMVTVIVNNADWLIVDHAIVHTVASHSDTTATGAELDELTDGSVTTLHSHA